MQQNQFPIVQDPQTVQVQVASPTPPQRSKHTCAVKSLGILQIIAACLSVLFHIVSWATGSYLGVIASPIWGGLLFYLPAGILGIVSVTTDPHKRRCLAVACMIMSILASLVAVVNIGMCAASASYNHYSSWYYYSSTPLILDSILVIIALAELVISIVAAVYCCLIMNTGLATNSTTIQYVPSQGYPNVVMYNQPAPPGYTVGTNAPGTVAINQQCAPAGMAMSNQPAALGYASDGAATEGQPAYGKSDEKINLA